VIGQTAVPYNSGASLRVDGTPVEERAIGSDAAVAGSNTVSNPVNSATTPNGGVIAIPRTAEQPSADQPRSQVAAVPQSVLPAAPAPQQATTSNRVATLSEQDYYQQGFDLLKQSKHDQAVSVFKQQINDYPNGELVDDAYYWIAESMYVNRSLDTSKQYFKTIIDKFAQSPRVPDAMLKTAYIEQEQGNQIEARILLQEIIQFHPRSNAAISAKNRLTDLN